MNRVCISGRLGREPYLANAGENNERLNFSIAVNQGRGDRQTTNWIPVTVFGKSASVIKDNVVVGQELHIAGRLEASNVKAKREASNGNTYEEPIWGIIADAYEGVTFGRRPGEGNGNGGGSQTASSGGGGQAEDEPPF